MTIVLPNVPMSKNLKEKIKLAIKRYSRRVIERSHDAMTYCLKIKNLKIVKEKKGYGID